MTISHNFAAWLKTPRTPLTVDSATKARAGPGEVVIKNSHVAINPIDWKIQTYDFGSQTYPNILGKDIAGEIVEVGDDVTRFGVGDRVIAHTLGGITNEPKYGGFQLYTVAYEITISSIPSTLPYSQAVVLPLAVSTAAAGLYQKGYLELPYPTLHPALDPKSKSSGKTILIWGGSSSVGSTAIQLAKASGLKVITTASKKNLGYVRSLGATWAFDYRSESVARDIVYVLRDTKFMGAYDAISLSETLGPVGEIVHSLGGGKVATVLDPPIDGLPRDVDAIRVSSSDIVTKQPEVGDAIWRKYVPKALEAGQLQAKPDPIIIKGGLHHVQEALDTLKKGVSAAKVVVEL